MPTLTLPVRTAEELREWRAGRSLSQRALAQQLDVTEMTIWRWENGQTTIPRTVQLALAYLDRETD